MNDRAYWSQVSATFEAILAHIKEATQHALQTSALNTVSGHWYHLVQAVNVLPETVYVKRLQYRLPYTSPKRLAEALQILSARGVLRPAGPQQYAATDRAKAAIDVVTLAQRRIFRGLASLPDADLVRLRALLDKLLIAVDSLESVPHPSYSDARRRPITEDQPLIEQVARQLSLLDQFRSDAHVAAWMPHTHEGITIETLTLLWQGTASDVDTLEAELPYRGYAPRDYESALKRLTKMGWAESYNVEHWRITEQGRVIRENIEQQTEANFAAPFEALTEAERETLMALLVALETAVSAASYTPVQD